MYEGTLIINTTTYNKVYDIYFNNKEVLIKSILYVFNSVNINELLGFSLRIYTVK